jgi:hypothetical protein
MLALTVSLAALILAHTSSAHADSRAKKKIQQETQLGMDAYDILDFKEAKKKLQNAILLAKKNGLEKDNVTAKAHLALGIVYFSGFKDPESAKLQFIEAVSINNKIQLDAAYKTGKLSKLLEEARKEYGKRGTGGGNTSGGGSDGGSSDSIDCGAIDSIKHTIVDSAPAGKNVVITAHVGTKLKAKKVRLHYRPYKMENFIATTMSKKDGCTYQARIPAKYVKGDYLHYYVAAYNGSGKILASKGSSGSPNIIEPQSSSGGSGGSGGGLDTENPLAGGGGGGSSSSITKKGPKRPSHSKLFLAVAVGTGGGYVSGETEDPALRNKVGCCFAPALLHVFPELGYFLSKQTSLSFAFRMGFPVGANRQGHATAAPSGLLRLRYALDKSGNGLQVNAAAGFGIIRHIVKLSDVPAGEGDVDTVASGPLLLGGGVAYSRPMGGPIKFVAEVNSIAGLPVAGISGVDDPSFAVQFDVNLGLLFAF